MMKKGLLVFVFVILFTPLEGYSKTIAEKAKHNHHDSATKSLLKDNKKTASVKNLHQNLIKSKLSPAGEKHVLGIQKSDVHLPKVKINNLGYVKSLLVNEEKYDARSEANANEMSVGDNRNEDMGKTGLQSKKDAGLSSKIDAGPGSKKGLSLGSKKDGSIGSKIEASLGSKKDGIPSNAALHANTNMLTGLKVPKLGQALQWIPNNGNESDPQSAQQHNNTTQQLNATQQSNTTLQSNATVDYVTDGNDKGNAKIKNLLDKLSGVAKPSRDAVEAGEMKSPVKIENEKHLKAGNLKDVAGNKKHEIIGPGYYEPECDDKKKCPDGHYCHLFICVDCHRLKHACAYREQCCSNMECVYGRCEQKPKGSPGAFCHKDKDCSGDACCVLEPTVDEEESICKPKLAEYHQCSPILFRKVWIGDNKPDCGPCKDGLKCMQKGNEGSHEVCMKET